MEVSMDRAIQLAKMYIEQNLIINLTNKLHANVQMFLGEDFQKAQKIKEVSQLKDREDLETDVIFQLQDQEQIERQITFQIESFFVFQRNLTFLSFHTSTLLYEFYQSNANLIQLDQVLIFKTIFLLQKYSLVFINRIINMLKNDQDNPFDSQDWFIYNQSGIFLETLAQIKNDKIFMLSQFQDVMQTVKQMVTEEEFLEILDDDLAENESFIKNYQRIIKQVLVELNTQVVKNRSNPQVQTNLANLVLIKYIFLLISPQQSFKWNQDSLKSFNFCQFYEESHTYEVVNIIEYLQTVLENY